MNAFSKAEAGIWAGNSETLDGFVMTDMDRWPRYQKKVATSAMRVDGPFQVDTSEGTLTCKDGYLCIDARGYPYPVAKDEFDLIYERVA